MPKKKNYTTEEKAALFGVLSDPTRLKLLELLAQQKEPDALCVFALALQLGVTQPAISQHLRVLKSAGLVKGERRGFRVHYFINHAGVDQARAHIINVLPVKHSNKESKGDL